jgi:hypothetical protein
MIRRRKKAENEDRTKEGKKAIVFYDKNESKYFDKLLIQLSERKNSIKQITRHNDIAVLDSYRYPFRCLIC